MEKPPQIYIGAFTIALLSDGIWRNDGGCMLGVVPRELWQREHPADHQNRIRLNLTCPLIIKGNQAILVDTGIGNRLSAVERKIFDHQDGWLLEGLAMLGMEPGDVTHILLSHLHFDHCGGIVRRRASGKLEAAFPRARIFVQRGELEIAANTKNERLRAAYRHLQECLEPVGPAIIRLNGNTELIEGVNATVTGGHTADHQVAVVRSGGDTFVHLADIVPTHSHMRGPWNQAYDLDALTTMEQKRKYLEEAIDHRWWLAFAHDDRVLAAQVKREGGKIVLDEVIAGADTADQHV
ncbi:MAG TPA: MBL fold metallo-hydrolase [Candidatus Binataceae bacterium]|nr:MBL fold metallo-hydrolase [Candidatus Binataceae bacterium]